MLDERLFSDEAYSLKVGTVKGLMRGEAENVRDMYDALSPIDMNEMDFQRYVAELLKHEE